MAAGKAEAVAAILSSVTQPGTNVVDDQEKNKLVDDKSAEGMTALHEACRNGHSECVKLLVQHKANVNMLTSSGYTPLHVCIQVSKREARVWAWGRKK